MTCCFVLSVNKYLSSQRHIHHLEPPELPSSYYFILKLHIIFVRFDPVSIAGLRNRTIIMSTSSSPSASASNSNSGAPATTDDTSLSRTSDNSNKPSDEVPKESYFSTSPSDNP